MQEQYGFCHLIYKGDYRDLGKELHNMNRKKIAAALLAVMVFVPDVVRAGNMSADKETDQGILLLSEDAYTEAAYSENTQDSSLSSGEDQNVPTTTPEVTPEETPEPTPIVTPTVTPTVTPEPDPTSPPEVTPEATPTVTPSVTPEVTPQPTPEATVTPQPTPEVTLEATGESTPELSTNEKLIANQQIVIPPQVEPDFRLTKVDAEEAFSKGKHNVYEERDLDSDIVGQLPDKGVCYILENCLDGWYFIESGKVRGFVKEKWLLRNEEAENLRAQLENENKESLSAVIKKEPLENKSLLYTMTSAYDVVVEKVYAFCDTDLLNIREGKSTDDRILGTLSNGQLCYILEDEDIQKNQGTSVGKSNQGMQGVSGVENNRGMQGVSGVENNQSMQGTQSVQENQNVLINRDIQKNGDTPDDAGVSDDDGEEWLFVESGNVRGFVKKEYLLTGQESENRANEVLASNQEPETVFGTAEELIGYAENAVCYYTLTSVKEGSQTSQVRTALLNYAVQFTGNPYVWGGSDPVNGADCSGFAQHVYAQFGISLPRTSAAQSQYGMKIPVSEAAPGDLIFYAKNGIVYHVVIYLGKGKTIEAASSQLGITSLNVNYTNAVWATRVLQ